MFVTDLAEATRQVRLFLHAAGGDADCVARCLDRAQAQTRKSYATGCDTDYDLYRQALAELTGNPDYRGTLL